VHDALVAHNSARASFEAQDDRRKKQADVLRLAELRYKNGYSSYLEVLDAQRNLFQVDLDAIIGLGSLGAFDLTIDTTTGLLAFRRFP